MIRSRWTIEPKSELELEAGRDTGVTNLEHSVPLSIPTNRITSGSGGS